MIPEAEGLIDSLIVMARYGLRPKELVFPMSQYLQLAADSKIDVPGEPPRPFTRTPVAFSPREAIQTVRCADSFQLEAPMGRVTIRGVR